MITQEIKQVRGEATREWRSSKTWNHSLERETVYTECTFISSTWSQRQIQLLTQDERKLEREQKQLCGSQPHHVALQLLVRRTQLTYMDGVTRQKLQYTVMCTRVCVFLMCWYLYLPIKPHSLRLMTCSALPLPGWERSGCPWTSGCTSLRSVWSGDTRKFHSAKHTTLIMMLSP